MYLETSGKMIIINKTKWNLSDRITSTLLIIVEFWPCGFFSLKHLCLQVLICRNYMGDMDMNEIDHFMPMLMKKEEDAEMTPLVSHGPSHFLWLKHNNLYCIHLFRVLKVTVTVSVSAFPCLQELSNLSELRQLHISFTISHLCSFSDSVSPQSESQHVEKKHMTSVWWVRGPRSLFIQHHFAAPQMTDVFDLLPAPLVLC